MPLTLTRFQPLQRCTFALQASGDSQAWQSSKHFSPRSSAVTCPLMNNHAKIAFQPNCSAFWLPRRSCRKFFQVKLQSAPGALQDTTMLAALRMCC